MEPTIKNGSYIICLNTVGHLRDAFQNELSRQFMLEYTVYYIPYLNGLKVE